MPDAALEVPSAPARLAGGRVVALYLFDIAETVALDQVPRLIQEPVSRSRLVLKPATPAYVQYERPPLTFEGEVADPNLAGWSVRFRLYDYGVISVALMQPAAADWPTLVASGAAVIENPSLEKAAEALCRRTVDRIRPALNGVRDSFLTEDYVVYVAEPHDTGVTADEVLTVHGSELAKMLRGEQRTLSLQEEQQVLQFAMSYLADDLVIASWNAAFVLDSPASAAASIEIFEFANSQLLQFRYYDQWLDEALTSIYLRLQNPRWYERWIGSRYARAARHVHAVYIDVNELTDRTENALKFVGDVYAARLYSVVADRLGLKPWRANVEEKLETLDDIYRSVVEQSSMARGELMELSIVLILVLELILVFLGVMN